VFFLLLLGLRCSVPQLLNLGDVGARSPDGGDPPADPALAALRAVVEDLAAGTHASES
jgi:hypothetical protein